MITSCTLSSKDYEEYVQEELDAGLYQVCGRRAPSNAEQLVTLSMWLACTCMNGCSGILNA